MQLSDVHCKRDVRGWASEEVLAAQERAAEKDGLDEISYARQREAIYNQFIVAGRRR